MRPVADSARASDADEWVQQWLRIVLDSSTLESQKIVVCRGQRVQSNAMGTSKYIFRRHSLMSSSPIVITVDS